MPESATALDRSLNASAGHKRRVRLPRPSFYRVYGVLAALIMVSFAVRDAERGSWAHTGMMSAACGLWLGWALTRDRDVKSICWWGLIAVLIANAFIH